MPLFFQCHLNSFKMDKVKVWFHILYLNIIYLEFMLRYFFTIELPKCLTQFLFFCSFLFILFYFLLLKYICHHFLPTTLPCATHPHLPPSILPLFGCAHGSFYMFLDDPSPTYPLLSPSPHSSSYCQFVLISMSLVIICLLVCFVD